MRSKDVSNDKRASLLYYGLSKQIFVNVQYCWLKCCAIPTLMMIIVFTCPTMQGSSVMKLFYKIKENSSWSRNEKLCNFFDCISKLWNTALCFIAPSPLPKKRGGIRVLSRDVKFQRFYKWKLFLQLQFLRKYKILKIYLLSKILFSIYMDML